MQTEPNWTLLTRYISNECNEEERLEFDTWLKASDKNFEQFNQMKEALQAYDQNTGVNYKPNKSKAWEKIDKATHAKTIDAKAIFKWTSRIAASIILFLGIYYIFNISSNETEQIVLSQASNSGNEAKMIVLSDGTKVWLNSQTALNYPEKFSGKQRVVELDGEAYFEVKKDKQHPFIIKTQTTVTEVLGTSFNLRAYKNESSVKIVVNSGKVAFSDIVNKKRKVILQKGNSAEYLMKNKKIVRSNNSDFNYNAWKTKVFRFSKTSLEDVCKTLEKHYDKIILIEEESIKSQLITASYHQQSFEEVAQTISYTLDIRCKLEGDSLIFFK